MTTDETGHAADLWSDWLLNHRDAGDPQFAEIVHGVIERYADRVLDGARLSPGMTLADIGAGEGIVAFRAIDRLGPSLKVLLTDISAPMLRHAEALAAQRGVAHLCTFLHCCADSLKDIEDASVDVVTTRAVLAYVSDKAAALREFHRILKPGGRISIAEPVFQDDAFAARALRAQLESQSPESAGPFMPLLHRWMAAQFPDTEEAMKASPIANYSERDLLRLAQQADFVELHLELHIDIARSIIRSWDVFLRTSPHPWAPPLNVILAQQFTEEERQLFERIMRPAVEDPNAVSPFRIVYLTAGKPLR